jgi:hypothetical protein
VAKVVCDPTTIRTYTGFGATPTSFRWRVINETIVENATSSAVQLQWNATGTGTLIAKGISAYGCVSDSITQTVVTAPPLTMSGSLNICQGSTTSLTVTGGTLS